MKRNIVLLSYFFILFKLLSQELELSEKHEELFKTILKMNIIVRIYKNQDKPLWNAEQSKLTIPGKSVTLKLESKELKVYGIFTPYKTNDNIVLLAQSQVILLPPLVDGLQYFNSVKTLVVTFNESIFFYPLGRKEHFSNSEGGDIEIELQLSPYLPSDTDKAGSTDNGEKSKAGIP